MEKCLKYKLESEKNINDPKFIGCYADIRAQLNAKCGGTQICEVPVAKIDEETPCYSYLRYYLEATYSCLKG